MPFRDTFVANNRLSLRIHAEGFDFTTIAADSVQLDGNFIDIEPTGAGRLEHAVASWETERRGCGAARTVCNSRA